MPSNGKKWQKMAKMARTDTNRNTSKNRQKQSNRQNPAIKYMNGQQSVE